MVLLLCAVLIGLCVRLATKAVLNHLPITPHVNECCCCELPLDAVSPWMPVSPIYLQVRTTRCVVQSGPVGGEEERE